MYFGFFIHYLAFKFCYLHTIVTFLLQVRYTPISISLCACSLRSGSEVIPWLLIKPLSWTTHDITWQSMDSGWIQILLIPRLLSVAKEIFTILQSDTAINPWLATSPGNINAPQILSCVLRAFSPIFLASLLNLMAFFTMLIFLLALLFTLTAPKKWELSVDKFKTSCYSSPELACIYNHSSFISFCYGRNVPVPLWMELFSTSSVGPMHSCLLRVFVDYSFFILFSYCSLSTDFVFFLYVNIIISYKHQAPVTFYLSPFLLSHTSL